MDECHYCYCIIQEKNKDIHFLQTLASTHVIITQALAKKLEHHINSKLDKGKKKGLSGKIITEDKKGKRGRERKKINGGKLKIRK